MQPHNGMGEVELESPANLGKHLRPKGVLVWGERDCHANWVVQRG